MLLLVGMVQSDIQEFLNQYIPEEYLTQNYLIGLVFILFLMSLSVYAIYRNKGDVVNKDSNQSRATTDEGVSKSLNKDKNNEVGNTQDNGYSKLDRKVKRTENRSGEERVKNELNLDEKDERNSENDKKESEDSKDPTKVEEHSTTYQQSNEKQKKEWRKQKSDPLDDVLPNQQEDRRGILYIGYDPTDKFEQKENWKYAVVKMPGSGSVIRQPVNGKQQIRGYEEEGFQQLLESTLSNDFNISGNALISTGNQTRPYEPDIFLSYLKNERNIFIDIEIDEPYGGVTRNATHIEGEDDIRDHYFTDRGWLVIRFAEIQVHQQPQRCAGLVAKVIREIAPEIELSENLLENPLPGKVEQWDILKAQEWEKQNYREQYLNHEFKRQRDRKVADSAVELSEQDIEVEKKVEPTKYINEEHEPSKGKVNNEKWEERDNRIKFFPDKHIYLVDGIQAKSVTEVVDRFFPAFDREGISRKIARKRGVSQREILEEWDKARDLGSNLHKQIENYFNENQHEEPLAFSYFKNFLNDHSSLNTFRTEWRVFDDKRLIAGTIDYVAKNSDGTFSIYDWKRSKNVVDEYNGGPQINHPFGTGFGKLSHIDSTAYNKYCLQQGIYKKIIETHYGISVKDMYLVVMHPRYNDYHKFGVVEYEDEVEHILRAI